MKKEFVKFYIQVFKWNKDTPDAHYVDISFIKSSSSCVLLHKINKLFEDIKLKISRSTNIFNIENLTMIEESLPSKG
jgi:uncharacterized protein YoxC